MNVDKSNINYLLTRLFDRDVVFRGKTLQKEGAVLSLSINAKEGTILAEVQGTDLYFVKLNYNVGSNAITGLNCSCPYKGYCKHIVATLVQTTKNDTPPQIVKSYKLPIAKSNTFREIPFTSFEELFNRVQQLAPSGVRTKFEFNNLRYDTTLEKNNSLKVQGFSSNYWNNKSEVKLDVDVVKTEKYIAVRCNSCSSTVESLCSHTYSVLTNILQLAPVQDYINNEIDYDRVNKEYADKENLTLEKTAELLAFKMIKTGLVAEEKVKGYLNANKVKDFSNKMSQIIQDQFLSSDKLVSKQNKNGSDPYMNALMWNIADDSSLFPEVIAGKATVAWDRLKSDIYKDKTAQYAENYLKPSINVLTEKKVVEKMDEEYLSTVVEQLALVEDHISTIMSLPQYLNNDLYYDFSDLYSSFKKSDLLKLTFVPDKIKIKPSLEVDHNICILQVNLEIGKVLCPISETTFIHPLFAVFNRNNQAAFFTNHFDSDLLSGFKEKGTIQFSIHKTKELYPILNFMSDHYGLVIPSELIEDTNQEFVAEKQIYLKSINQDIIFTPVLHYGPGIDYNAITRFALEDSGEYVQVDRQGANDFLDWLRELHPHFSESSSHIGFLKLSKDEFLGNYWFSEFFDNCKEAEVAVLGYDQLELSKINKNKPSITSSIVSGIDWFDTKIEMKFGDLDVPMKAWVSMIKNRERFVKLSDGSLGIVPQEWIDKLTRMVEIADTSQSELRISKYHFNLLDEVIDDVDSYDWYQEVKEKKEKLLNYESNQDYTLPSNLTAELRVYQEKGYHWLRFLHEFSFGGCLADDMGLGKTVQVISLLAYLKEQGSCFALVIVPNSLLFNWANELNKFCSDLRYIVHHGVGRDISLINKDEVDIVITTYGTAVSDVMKLKNFIFDYLILDESQAIKNPMSKRNKAMRALQGKNKLVMTGTPIENNTLDLFGQFNFLNPGMLGSQGEFVNNFSKAIDVNGDKQQAEMLKKIIHPFILRRTKEQVAPDLPPKSEMVLYCEMDKDQRKHYESLLNTVKQDVVSHIEEQGVAKSKMKILEALLRLRQICNATQLVDKASNSSSTKINTLLEHIQSNNQHKCLVFSQFVGMLSLIRAELDKQGIKYAYLDGQTRDREASVKMFQEEDDCKIFLISLKAGNTGLNLTEADYVYIVDPWWNPAVEAQAIDRTHRIGQDKHIFAYRMICKDTIEEKIVKLQEKKRTLSQDLVQTDDNVFKTLDKEELLSIFD